MNLVIKTVYTGGDDIVVITDFNRNKGFSKARIDLKNGIFEAEIPALFPGTVFINIVDGIRLIDVVAEMAYNSNFILKRCVRIKEESESSRKQNQIEFEYTCDHTEEFLNLTITNDSEDRELEWIIRNLRPDLRTVHCYMNDTIIEFDNTYFWSLGEPYYEEEKQMIKDKAKSMALIRPKVNLDLRL